LTFNYGMGCLYVQTVVKNIVASVIIQHSENGIFYLFFEKINHIPNPAFSLAKVLLKYDFLRILLRNLNFQTSLI